MIPLWLKRIVFFGTLVLFLIAAWNSVANAATVSINGQTCALASLIYQPPLIVFACGTVFIAPTAGVSYSAQAVLTVPAAAKVDRIFASGFN